LHLPTTFAAAKNLFSCSDMYAWRRWSPSHLSQRTFHHQCQVI
jgi:hypothetical protein